jgi:hypothetical protein
MNDEVHRTVHGYADSQGEEVVPAGRLNCHGHQDDANRGEEEGKDIVQFESAFPGPVMASVEDPEQLVIYVSVRQIGDPFHGTTGDSGNEGKPDHRASYFLLSISEDARSPSA